MKKYLNGEEEKLRRGRTSKLPGQRAIKRKGQHPRKVSEKKTGKYNRQVGNQNALLTSGRRY